MIYGNSGACVRQPDPMDPWQRPGTAGIVVR